MRASQVDTSFKRLPFNFCAASLQPFTHPVCTIDGTIFDISNILPWLKKHGTNPVNGQPFKSSELIKLNFAKNEDGDYIDPVTFKVFTDNTHIVALKPTGNVFAHDTVDRLNIKERNWKDLVSDQEFGRKDIITLQDPQNVESRNLSSFKHIKDGVSTSDSQEKETVNKGALGNAARILKAKEAVALARSKRDPSKPNDSSLTTKDSSTNSKSPSNASHNSRSIPANAARYTTGLAAGSFTSTGMTPHTAADLAILSEEDYLLAPRRVKQPGFAKIVTNHGDINLELYPEFAPRAVWNFIHLAKAGKYGGVTFHRNIRNFMIQGGDPTGNGKGGQSMWGKNFVDEFDGPRVHDGRGVVSMANKGKDTNSSQFFITYRAAAHLNRKHTIFGQVVDSDNVLKNLENVKVEDTSKKPVEDIVMEEVHILIDPFEEFKKERDVQEKKENTELELQRRGGTEDDKVTWTGKRVRGTNGQNGGLAAGDLGVGKYLKTPTIPDGEDDEIVGEWEEPEADYHVKKKVKSGGGFGNFDGW